MSFTDTREILLKAQAGGYAVGAFNVENLEMIQAVISAAEKENSPVIIQTTPGTLKYAPPEAFAGAVRALAAGAAVPVALHLDHGNSYELTERCRNAGYSSLTRRGGARHRRRKRRHTFSGYSLYRPGSCGGIRRAHGDKQLRARNRHLSRSL